MNEKVILYISVCVFALASLFSLDIDAQASMLTKSGTKFIGLASLAYIFMYCVKIHFREQERLNQQIPKQPIGFFKLWLSLAYGMFVFGLLCMGVVALFSV